jgi:pimeloyl-ACP methyl ester carboxylesterase
VRETRIHVLRDGRDLAYLEFGDPGGFPVFYCHGTPGSRLEGAFPDRAAKAHGFRIIAVDRPGFGRSTFQPDRTFRDWPADVASLADALGVGEFGITGHSGGGPHLFACGVLIPPGRLRFIGALAPWGPIATPEIMAGLNRLDRVYARLARRAPWAMRASFAPLGWCAKHWPRLFFAIMTSAVSTSDRVALASDGVLEQLRESELEAFRQGGRGSAHEATIAYRPWDIDVPDIRVPTHIWLGDQDIFVPRQMGSYLQDAIPEVDFHQLVGAGHFAVSAWDEILAACAADIR